LGQFILIPMNTNNYNTSFLKWALDVILSSIGLFITFPLILLISLIIRLTEKDSVFFLQKRAGEGGKTFKIIKFRTMVPNAEKIQSRLKKLNEADGPVFKIIDDPRFTKFGKILSKTGLDELPQLINVLKGEMSMVGPRPLPVSEAKKLSLVHRKRNLIKPGLTSLWIVNGSHSMSFNAWMKSDQLYIKKASFNLDMAILAKTVLIILKSCLSLFLRFIYSLKA
jgi:lipopolysaccharide/colanic/teichoic acid biosynthesis glycosyltransferase